MMCGLNLYNEYPVRPYSPPPVKYREFKTNQSGFALSLQHKRF